MSGNFNMSDYVDVAERIREFAERYPEGSLQSEMTKLDDGWLCKAFAFRSPTDDRPGVGHAFEPVPGKTPYTKDSEAMNAETSAWGRAIVALGFQTKKIASREEVQARQGNGHAPEPQPQRQATDAHSPGSMEVGFGKHKGKLIRDVPRDYWEWWLASDMAAKPNFSELRAEVELWMGLGMAPDGMPDADRDDLDEVPF